MGNSGLPEKKQKQLVEYWLSGARDDLETATAVAKGTTRFHAALFYAHLAIEKSLKAEFVKATATHAPYTHNLLHLVAKIGWELDEQEAHIRDLLVEFNDFNLEGRYPDEKETFHTRATETYTKEKLKNLDEVLQWISQRSKLSSSS